MLLLLRSTQARARDPVESTVFWSRGLNSGSNPESDRLQVQCRASTRGVRADPGTCTRSRQDEHNLTCRQCGHLCRSRILAQASFERFGVRNIQESPESEAGLWCRLPFQTSEPCRLKLESRRFATYFLVIEKRDLEQCNLKARTILRYVAARHENVGTVESTPWFGLSSSLLLCIQ